MQKYNLFRNIASVLVKKRLSDCVIRVFLPALTPILSLLFLPCPARSESLEYGCVVFSELMTHPEPVVGLPNVEYVEVYNRSGSAIDLGGWVFWYDNHAFRLQAFTLPSRAYVILCGSAGATLFDSSVNVLCVPSFPVLARTDKTIGLTSAEGELMCSLAYLDAWYDEAFKRKGGWSLECVDTNNLSGLGSNWKASVDSTGGTPGRNNAVTAWNPDVVAPVCSRLWVSDASTVVLRFSEHMDPEWLSDPNNMLILDREGSIAGGYWFQGGDRLVYESTPLWPLYLEVELSLGFPLREGETVVLRLTAPLDVGGNVGRDTIIRVGLPVKPEPFDLSINELLFNPDASGCDYVEVVNRSARCLDLSQVWLCGRNENGTLKEGCRLFEEPVPAMPGSYWVLSSMGDSLAERNGCDSVSHFPRLKGFPSMPDKSGTVVLVTTDNCIIDECTYSTDWHMPLFSIKDGIALEKLHPDKPSNEWASWMSASSLSGYGTPGRRNSQYTEPRKVAESFLKLNHAWISPNGDGRDDVLTVALKVGVPGTVSLTLYNLSGQTVCHWIRNEWVGVDQEINWNGTDDTGAILPMGRYILLVTLTRTDGTVQTAKSVVTVL